MGQRFSRSLRWIQTEWIDEYQFKDGLQRFTKPLELVGNSLEISPKFTQNLTDSDQNPVCPLGAIPSGGTMPLKPTSDGGGCGSAVVLLGQKRTVTRPDSACGGDRVR